MKVGEKEIHIHWINTWYWMQPCDCDEWMVIQVNIFTDYMVYEILKGSHYTWEAS